MGLSQGDLEERAGLDRTVVCRLESGRNRNPTVDTLSRCAGALGLTLVLNLEPAPRAPGRD
jgi:transcriptional regulator with XRE-family HTH domain